MTDKPSTPIEKIRARCEAIKYDHVHPGRRKLAADLLTLAEALHAMCAEHRMHSFKEWDSAREALAKVGGSE